jgi:hypothetical protein
MLVTPLIVASEKATRNPCDSSKSANPVCLSTLSHNFSMRQRAQNFYVASPRSPSRAPGCARMRRGTGGGSAPAAPRASSGSCNACVAPAPPGRARMARRHRRGHGAQALPTAVAWPRYPIRYSPDSDAWTARSALPGRERNRSPVGRGRARRGVFFRCAGPGGYPKGDCRRMDGAGRDPRLPASDTLMLDRFALPRRFRRGAGQPG